MASAPSTKRMREEATCSICLNLMMDPMSVTCGHSYCCRCITDFLNNLRQLQHLQKVFPCPQCRALCSMESLRPNKQLGNLIEAIKEMEQGISCGEHGEQLQLFCEDDGQLICWRCERTSHHQGHTTALVEDVCHGYREKIQKAVTQLKKLEEECTDQKKFMTMQITKWKEKIETRRQKIRCDFEALQMFLQKEQASYLWRLEKEEKQLLRKLRDGEASLEKQSQELRNHIQGLEERCQGPPQKLLKDVKDTLDKSWAVKLEAPETFVLEVLTTCNVSELYFDVKKMLKSNQVSVTLDPATAHRELTLSEDRRQVTRGWPQENIEASPRRFSTLPCVLGYEGFSSGKHFFEVDVGEGTGWDLGVCVESVPRGSGIKQKPQCGFWAIRLCRKRGYIALTYPPTPLFLNPQPLVVGVFLDCEAGLVSFYNMTTGVHIFTFPKTSFSDTVRPYFQVYHCSPLFLPPPGE